MALICCLVDSHVWSSMPDATPCEVQYPGVKPVECTVGELRERVIDVLHVSPKHPLAGSDQWRRRDFLGYNRRQFATSCHTPAYVWRNIFVKVG